MENKKYCVYLHRRKDNGEIFYVGEGSLRRPYAACKYTRSKLWQKVKELAGGFIVEIVKTNLSKSEAQQLELKLIELYRKSVVNTKLNTKPREIDIDFISNFVEYSESIPSYLIWKTTGKMAGKITTINNKEYWKVSIQGRYYRIHRLVVMLHGLCLNKEQVVDHIDGNGLNNHIGNLKICTQQINMKNVQTSGKETIGVKENKTRNCWIAYWQENCQQKTKSFSINKYGYEEARKLALNYRIKMTTLPVDR